MGIFQKARNDWCPVPMRRGETMIGEWIKEKLETLKWEIAHFLNRNPDYCWSNLTSWVLYDKWSDIWRHNSAYKHKLCTIDKAYCGKCRYQWQRKHSYKQYNDYVKGLWDRGRDVKYGGKVKAGWE